MYLFNARLEEGRLSAAILQLPVVFEALLALRPRHIVEAVVRALAFEKLKFGVFSDISFANLLRWFSCKNKPSYISHLTHTEPFSIMVQARKYEIKL